MTVKADGPAYVVSFDLRAVNGLLKQAGGPVSYEPALIVYKLFEQDDGKWRVVMDSFPKLVAHAKDTTTTLEVKNLNQTVLIDPTIAWWLNGSATADAVQSTTHAPDIDQTMTFGPLKADYATTVGAQGAVSSTVKEMISDLAFKVAGSQQAGPAGQFRRPFR